MSQKFSISNKYCSFKYYINQRILKKVSQQLPLNGVDSTQLYIQCS